MNHRIVTLCNLIIRKIVTLCRLIIWKINTNLLFMGVLLWIVGIAFMMRIRGYFNFETYDIKDIIIAILNSEPVSKVTGHDFLGVIIFLAIPFVLPLFFKCLIEYVYIPSHIHKKLKHLNECCREIAGMGRGWIVSSVDSIINRIDGLKNGVHVLSGDKSNICNTLYSLSYVKQIDATCLKNIEDLYIKEKTYLDTTMDTILQLNKFRFTRYYVNDLDLTNVFNNTPTDAVKWFVNLHNKDKINLRYIEKKKFIEHCKSRGVSLEWLDVLFYTGAMLVALQTDPNNSHEVLSFPPNGANNLRIIDFKEALKKYDVLFKILKTYSIEVIDDIKQRNLIEVYQL